MQIKVTNRRIQLNRIKHNIKKHEQHRVEVVTKAIEDFVSDLQTKENLAPADIAYEVIKDLFGDDNRDALFVWRDRKESADKINIIDSAGVKGVYLMVHYQIRRKAPCFSYGDIRRAHRICVSY